MCKGKSVPNGQSWGEKQKSSVMNGVHQNNHLSSSWVDKPLFDVPVVTRHKSRNFYHICSLYVLWASKHAQHMAHHSCCVLAFSYRCLDKFMAIYSCFSHLPCMGIGIGLTYFTLYMSLLVPFHLYPGLTVSPDRDKYTKITLKRQR